MVDARLHPADVVAHIVAPSSEAQAPLCQPTVLRGAVGIANGLSFGMQSNMASLSLFMMRQWLLA
jgi:hypothetical protein